MAVFCVELDGRLTFLLKRLDKRDTFLTEDSGMNYAQSKQDALQEKENLLKRREAIAHERDRLDRENGEIERQLIGLDQVLEGLEFLDSNIPPEIEKPGFTEQIRRILQQTSLPLTAVEIRDSLLRAGIEHSTAKNLLISVHTVLGRLHSDLKKTEKDGKPGYTWKHARRYRHVAPSGMRRAFYGEPPSAAGLLGRTFSGEDGKTQK
jgi:hypothetical protein